MNNKKSKTETIKEYLPMVHKGKIYKENGNIISNNFI